MNNPTSTQGFRRPQQPSERLAEAERALQQVREQLAQAQSELTRLRARAQVEARRGF